MVREKDDNEDHGHQDVYRALGDGQLGVHAGVHRNVDYDFALVKQKWTVKGTNFSSPAILDRTLRNEK